QRRARPQVAGLADEVRVGWWCRCGLRPVVFPVLIPVVLVEGVAHRVAPACARRATARSVSSTTRSALICAATRAPSADAALTWADRSVALPATHTPGTAVRPVWSAAM